MKSSRLLLICFLVLVPVIISGEVISSGDQDQKAAKHTTWEVLFEDFAKRNVTHLDRNMQTLSGCDDDLYQVWLSHDRSEAIKIINEALKDKEHVISKIEKVGSILFGPEKARSILGLAKGPDYDSQCVESSMNLFALHCGFLSEVSVKHTLSFVNMCNQVGDKASIKEAIIATCGDMNNTKSFAVDVKNPAVHVIPAPTHGSSDYCERVFVNGVSRKFLGSFAKIYRVKLIPYSMISHNSPDKAQICVHGDASLGLCQCGKDDWRPLKGRLWSLVLSPYENKIIDIKFTDGIHGFVYLSLEEELQVWRYFFLTMGIALLFLAPGISKYILSPEVDDMGGLFIKWVMRVIAVACIFQSSVDTPFAITAVVTCLTVYCVTSYIKKKRDITVKLAEKSLARGDNKSK